MKRAPDHVAIREQLVELVFVCFVKSLDFPIQLRRPRFDIDVLHAQVNHVPVEQRLELVAAIGADGSYPKRELFHHAIDEVDGIRLRVHGSSTHSVRKSGHAMPLADPVVCQKSAERKRSKIRTLKTRRIEIAEILPRPDGVWMSQIARNLTDCEDGFLNGSSYLIHDRDPLFTRSFRGVLESSGIKTVKLPARSPNLNAYAERFVRSIKSECLAEIIPLCERHLRKAVKQYTAHYHLERNHQGIDNRLGGVLNYYERRAA